MFEPISNRQPTYWTVDKLAPLFLIAGLISAIGAAFLGVQIGNNKISASMIVETTCLSFISLIFFILGIYTGYKACDGVDEDDLPNNLDDRLKFSFV